MRSQIVTIPCEIEARYLARRILRTPTATPDDVDLAIDTLASSRDWQDIDLARRAREHRQASARIIAADRARAQAEAAWSRAAQTSTPKPPRRALPFTHALAFMLAATLASGIGAAAFATIQATTAQAAEWRAMR